MDKKMISDAIGPGAADELEKFTQVAASLPTVDQTKTGPQTGKFFDMMGYDGMAMLQSMADDHVRYVVLHNGSSHVLLAEVHACAEPTEKMMEPGKLVASYPYGATEDDWKVAFKLATIEAMRLAHIAPPPQAEACPGCGRTPKDGITASCFHPAGCGYFKHVDGRD